MDGRNYLGKKVINSATGFEGVVTQSVSYISNSQDRVLVQPKVDKDGKWIEGKRFDISELLVIG